MQQVFVVHYHEIALKGKNRPMFLSRLQENICRATGLTKKEVKIVSGRLIVHCPPPHPRPLPQGEREIVLGEKTKSDPSPSMGEGRVRVALGRVFGISSFSPAILVEAKYEEIEKTVGEIVRGCTPSNSPSERGRNETISSPFEGEVRRGYDWQSFAIAATRGDKKFSMTSQEMNIKLGAFVNEKFGKKVDLTNPDVTFYIEIFSGGALVYTERIPGPGGLPVGSQSKVAVMLSGGIDSPVAAYRSMKRGAPIVAIHFHSYPFTTRASIDKVKELAEILAQYGGPMKLYLVPLADAQKAVVQNCAEKYRVLLYRRLMVRIAEDIARKEGAGALVTGEALGQVASQTVENIGVVDAVLHCAPPLTPPRQGGETIQFPPLTEGRLGGVGATHPMPIFRPLIGYDKEEIISEARRIGTYEISILPHDDCCTLMMPKNPATRARLMDVEREEQKLDVNNLMANAISRCEIATALRASQ